MREKIVAGNWKMNMTRETGLSLADEIFTGLADGASSDVKVILAPSFPFISDLVSKADGSAVSVSAQNCYQEENGAFTGEVSVEMLKSFGCEYCIVGHSERRQYFGEDDALVNLKIQRLFSHGITPIYCCGESLEERESEHHFDVVGDQIQSALQGFTKDELSKIVIAYEPVWAIGTGITATPKQAQEMHAFIREKLSEVLSEHAEEISILYGGSVKPENASELFAQKDIDGGLIGGASLAATDFLQIIHSF
ncbi:MAG: triose-phosphate isomerase [Flavobacteriales bacterium]|nr:triose-phosphate isomerase [Flavobacteriales bacterium]